MSDFEKYQLHIFEKGKLISVNEKAIELKNESFDLFKSLYNIHYGSIYEDGNLISIHTGGWSDNEELIEEFKKTAWWVFYHKITQTGGHYYFNTDIHKEKEWVITSTM